MLETKSQRTARLEEEARLERQKEDEERGAAEMEREPQDRINEDPTGAGGQDADNPEEDEAIKHTSKLDKDFETLLRIIFKAKNDHHEVFEALHSEGIYS